MKLQWILTMALALVLLTLNLKASFVLARSSYYEKRQKIIQLVLVWVVPVLGGILVWAIASQPSATGSFDDGVDPVLNEESYSADHSTPGGGGFGGDSGS